MVQGVGSMSYHDAVDAVLYFLSYGHSQFLILLRPHVLAEHSKYFFSIKVANVGKFRHSSIKFTR